MTANPARMIRFDRRAWHFVDNLQRDLLINAWPRAALSGSELLNYTASVQPLSSQGLTESRGPQSGHNKVNRPSSRYYASRARASRAPTMLTMRTKRARPRQGKARARVVQAPELVRLSTHKNRTEQPWLS